MYAAWSAGSMHGPVERAASHTSRRAGGEKASARAGVTSTVRTGVLARLYLIHLEAQAPAFGDEGHASLTFAFLTCALCESRSLLPQA
mgnify:CR=1 FL=1